MMHFTKMIIKTKKGRVLNIIKLLSIDGMNIYKHKLHNKLF